MELLLIAKPDEVLQQTGLVDGFARDLVTFLKQFKET